MTITPALPSASRTGPVTPQEPLRLILDLDGDLGQRRRVLPVVMDAEQQVLVAAEQDANERLRPAAVAAVPRIHRRGGSWRTAGRSVLAPWALGAAFGP